MPSLKLELRTWRHFDDATEMIEDGGLCAKTPLQKRAAARRRAREKEGDLDIVEGALQLWLLLLLWCAIQGGLSSYIVQRDESDDLYA